MFLSDKTGELVGGVHIMDTAGSGSAPNDSSVTLNSVIIVDNNVIDQLGSPTTQNMYIESGDITVSSEATIQGDSLSGSDSLTDQEDCEISLASNDLTCK